MPNIGILGSTGMLGSALTKVLENSTTTVVEFNRAGESITGNNRAVKMNAREPINFDTLKQFDYVVNAIGYIKQIIDEQSASSVENAHQVNSEFPRRLNDFSVATGTPVIQIGTDCVYSGLTGSYSEQSPFDPIDVYGETKLQGELNSTATMILRTSIIGKEIQTSNSLLNWVIEQPINSKISGYKNHFWNGVTTLHFSKIVDGIVANNKFRAGKFHIVPSGVVSKKELVEAISLAFSRTDLEIEGVLTPNGVDRTLVTEFPENNQDLWKCAGYNSIPTIDEMVNEFSTWSH